MKVKELIERLKFYNQDSEVVLSDTNHKYGLCKCEVGSDLIINYVEEDNINDALEYFNDNKVVIIYAN